MVTANGEVQTNEEAQVYVHDLELFVTVQLLEDTLCPCHQVSSTKSTDTQMSGPVVKSHIRPKMGRTFPCRTENVVPVVVPGLSSSSRACSSSTSLAQDLSSSSIPANLRSDEGVLGNWRKPPTTRNQNKNGND